MGQSFAIDRPGPKPPLAWANHAAGVAFVATSAAFVQSQQEIARCFAC